MTIRISTADLALTINGREIVLIERTKPPFLHKLCLPGGHIDPTDRTPRHAALREGGEEIGFTGALDDLAMLCVLSGDGRDPRPHIGDSHVFHCDVPELPMLCAGSDAKRIHIRSLDSLEPDDMGFDHYHVISLLRDRGAMNAKSDCNR